MISNNVMSFMKKIVKSSSGGGGDDDSGEGTINKLKRTVTSGLQEMALVGSRSKPTLSHLTPEERDILQRVFEKEEQFEKQPRIFGSPGGSGVTTPLITTRKASSVGSDGVAAPYCRSCRKILSADELNYACVECGQLVCEDCSSYSKPANEQGRQGWKCSFCRRRQNPDRIDLYPPGTGMHRVPSVRRMNEKIANALKEAENIRFSESELSLPTIERRSHSVISITSDESFRMRANSVFPIESSGSLLDIKNKGSGGISTAMALSLGPTRRQDSSGPIYPLSRKASYQDTTTDLNVNKDKKELAVKKESRSLDKPKTLDDHLARDKPTEISPSTSRPQSPVDMVSRETGLSSGTTSDRRSSSEGTMPPSQLTGSSKRHSVRGQRQSFTTGHQLPAGSQDADKREDPPFFNQSRSSVDKASTASGSSGEDISRESDQERRKKNRFRRRSKIQRQKSYEEDPEDSDGTADDFRVQYGWRSRRETRDSSIESNSALESFDNEFGHRRESRVPGTPRLSSGSMEKGPRHAVSDANLYNQRRSSESSDVSDVSGDYSTHSERSGFNDKYEAGSRQASQEHSPKPHKKLFRHKRRENSEKMEKQLSPSGTADSSPSADDTDKYRRVSSDASQSYSVDEVEYGGRQESASAPPIPPRRDIPFVLVDNAAVEERPRKPSYELIYPPIEFSRRSSTGRALPKIPDSGGFSSLFPVLTGRTRSTHSLDIPREDLGLTERRASAPEGETIKIVIDDVDSEKIGQGESSNASSRPFKAILHRDPSDTGARTRGYGVRVMGGKADDDGRLHARVRWTTPGGPADRAGIKQGDRIIQWNGQSLDDLTYEEVSLIFNQSGDVVELLVESYVPPPKPDLRALVAKANGLRKRSAPSLDSIDLSTEGVEPLAQETSNSTSRRRLPKTPDQLCHDHMQGEVGVQIWFDQNRSDLLVTVIGARGLRRRRSSTGALPRPYAKIRLIPHTGHAFMKTQIADPCVNPEWNKTFIFTGVTSDNVLEKMLDISIWDNSSQVSNTFLGEAQIPLRRADLQDCPEWYPLSFNQPALLSPPHKLPPSAAALASLGASVSSPTPPPSVPVPSTPAHDYARRLLKRVTPTETSVSLSEDKGDDSYLGDEDQKGMVRSASMDCHENNSMDSAGGLKVEIPTERKTSAPNVIYQPVTSSPITQPTGRRGSQLLSQDSLPDLYNSTDAKGRERQRSASLRMQHRPSVAALRLESRIDKDP